MRQKVIKTSSYKLHLYKIKNYKSIDIRISFSNKIKKENITKSIFLFDLLVYCTNNYRSKRLLNIKCQELYSLALTSGTFRLGDYLVSRLGISFLNPKYTKDDITLDSLDLLKEVIFNPYVLNGAFNEEKYNAILADLEAETQTVKEQPRVYANIKLLENLGDKPYSYHNYCYEEDLHALDPKKLYDYYNEILNNSMIDIFVAGDFNFSDMQQIIRGKLSFKRRRYNDFDVCLEEEKITDKYREIEDKIDYNQSKLAIACKLNFHDDFEKKYVSNIYNILLGGSSDSILMRDVREASSLVYYINSTIIKADNLLIINAGCDAKNYQKIVDLVFASLQKIATSDFSDDDMNKAINEYISAIDTTLTSKTALLNVMMSTYFFKNDPLEMRKEEVLKVTKDMIVSFAKTIKVDTIYLLKGEK